MNIQIPSALEFKARLEPMGSSELAELARMSGVPFHTLLKIKTGETTNPGIETVRKFCPFLTPRQPEKATA